ncbi:LacI family DNA-binding transcriptional regulator [Curtobacterium sp. MCBD17_003]|uniref:LacI family DNA-binding transcriptional regulator n=1 Tax=Curtobacterium sp. MCBD17_003 TaxID=2175667 RepID=UPI000DA76A21|nr:LacI family DNA-binding transcriptional regulator [Curtobacterium sp. MCBD17_003]WIE54008.1 LacI family DNA-binding transcriptional regulator [Curtobacterium sp. MCBD17_003]
MLERRPTIRDVAAHAGVGFKSVSRVINDEGHVSDALRIRIETSIAALDYRPNAAARVLRKSVTRSIGFVCPEIAEPVQSRLAQAVETVAADEGSTLTITLTHSDASRERAAIESLVSRQVDGIVLVPAGGSIRYLTRIARGVPVLLLDRLGSGLPADAVLSDNTGGAATGTARLVAAGHRRIAFVGDSDELFTQQERYDGYCAALVDAGIALDQRLVYRAIPDVRRLRQQLEFWRRSPNPPTALFSANSVATMTLLEAIGDWHQPDLVAFDDFPLADVVRGGVTVVAQDVDTMGRVGAQTLFRRLAGDGGSPITTRVSTALIERGALARSAS